MCGLQFVQKAAELVEAVAELEYDQWVRLDISRDQPIPYGQLSEKRKDVYRNYAVNVIALIQELPK